MVRPQECPKPKLELRTHLDGLIAERDAALERLAWLEQALALRRLDIREIPGGLQIRVVLPEAGGG